LEFRNRPAQPQKVSPYLIYVYAINLTVQHMYPNIPAKSNLLCPQIGNTVLLTPL
jgi:hypothetical protein